ncbi:MAG: hypothetical protein LBJ00_16315 [Planctomycetaceae bacterium]|jgi:hypothetical protein|nr:hypothetical protein [Planctomycetaceae bacterium]
MSFVVFLTSEKLGGLSVFDSFIRKMGVKMRRLIFYLALFFVVSFVQNCFVLACNVNDDSGSASNGADAVELKIDDDIDAKLDGANFAQPNTTSTNKSYDPVNGKEIIWGKSAIAKENGKEPATKVADAKTLPNVSFGQLPSANQTGEEVKENPNPKNASKINQRYAELPTKNTPQPLPQPLPQPKSPVATSNKKNNDLYLLKSSREAGAVDLVETLLEVTGDVKQVGDEQKKASTEKMEVVAGFRYEERLQKPLAKQDSLVSVRQYNLAKAKMRIGKDVKTPELKDKTRTIVSRLENDKVVLFSPNGSLRGEELLLIEDLPGNTLTIDRLLPDKEVKVGDSWRISDAVLRSFLSIDTVTESRIDAVLTAVADNVAMVEIVGEIQGIYLGAETKMSVQAKYQFDMNIQRINWLGILIQEDRSIGHVGPGFNLVARLQVKISPLEKPQALTDDFISEINIQSNDRVLCLKYDGGKGAWRFAHDRSWYVFQDDTQTTVLRRLHGGELVAQCNIADMGRVDVDTMTTLDKFKKEISTGLGKNYRRVAAANQYTNEAGYKVYTVMIDGTVEDELPLRWIYNLLTDKDGQQTVVVFVIEAKMLKVFGDSDDMLLNTYRMIKKNYTEANKIDTPRY